MRTDTQLKALRTLRKLAENQMDAEPLSREYALDTTELLGGCGKTVSKLFKEGRQDEVGVYLLTLIFNNLKPKQ